MLPGQNHLMLTEEAISTYTSDVCLWLCPRADRIVDSEQLQTPCAGAHWLTPACSAYQASLPCKTPSTPLYIVIPSQAWRMTERGHATRNQHDQKSLSFERTPWAWGNLRPPILGMLVGISV